MRTAEDILTEKKRDPVWVRKDQSVFDAIQLMVEHAIGAILVKAGDRFIGIFTERDLLRNIALPGFNPKTAMVSDVMSSPLYCGTHDMTLLKLHEKFLGLFIRHLMIEKDGQQIGLISSGDVMRASLLEKDNQIKALNEIASWEYYEDWGWDRKKRKQK
jgi:signal-transduction protein with cAMP-binding, CBS, and nucleotidyltransferase domain